MWFLHDFRTTHGLKDIRQVREKFDFLFKRWEDLLSRRTKVMFVRQNATQADAKQIDATIANRYPMLTYKILVVNGKGVSWQTGRLVGRTVPYTKKWSGDDTGWKRVFEEAELFW